MRCQTRPASGILAAAVAEERIVLSGHTGAGDNDLADFPHRQSDRFDQSGQRPIDEGDDPHLVAGDRPAHTSTVAAQLARTLGQSLDHRTDGADRQRLGRTVGAMNRTVGKDRSKIGPKGRRDKSSQRTAPASYWAG